MTTEEQVEDTRSELDQVRIELEKAKMELEEKKKSLSEMSSRKISDEEKALIDKQIHRREEKQVRNQVIERQKAQDSEKVTGRFMNRRAPGQPAKLTYIKYEDDPVKWYTFEDGKVYTISRGFADQINEYYHTPMFVQKQAEMGPNRPSSVINDVDTSNKKYAFVPTGF